MRFRRRRPPPAPANPLAEAVNEAAADIVEQLQRLCARLDRIGDRTRQLTQRQEGGSDDRA